MHIARRNFIRKIFLGTTLIFESSLFSFYNYSSDDNVRFEFKLIFPEGRSSIEIQEELKRIFPSNTASVVDNKFILEGLAWNKVNSLTERYHSMKMSFKNLEVYDFWEKELKRNSSYNKELFKSLGYRFKTTKMS